MERSGIVQEERRVDPRTDMSPQARLRRERRARQAIELVNKAVRMMGYIKMTPIYLKDPRTGEKYCE